MALRTMNLALLAAALSLFPATTITNAQSTNNTEEAPPAALPGGRTWPDVVDRGYGPVPAAGTKMKNGWMCFEWGNADGYTFPIRVVNGQSGQPSGGVPACLASSNGNGCRWVSPWSGDPKAAPWTTDYGDWTKCQALVDTLNEDSPYLACGEPYKKLFTWDGFDQDDPESWCAAAAYALDLRPDELRAKANMGPLKSTFENAAGRPPNFPTKEQRPNPRPEPLLLAECTQYGWGCASCDELRYQCNDGIAPSCALVEEIPASCPGNGVRDTSLEAKIAAGESFTLKRYTQTTGRTSTKVPPPAPKTTTTAVVASTTVAAAVSTSNPVQVNDLPETSRSAAAPRPTRSAEPVVPHSGAAGALVAGLGAAVVAVAAAGLAL